MKRPFIFFNISIIIAFFSFVACQNLQGNTKKSTTLSPSLNETSRPEADHQPETADQPKITTQTQKTVQDEKLFPEESAASLSYSEALSPQKTGTKSLILSPQDKQNLSYNSIFSLAALSSQNININNHKENKGWLGTSLIEKKGNDSEGEQIEEKTIVIQYVVQGSPAKEFGLKKDDTILKLDGEPIKPKKGTSLTEVFAKKVQQLSPGTSITLTISRNEITYDINLTLGETPRASVIMADHDNLAYTIPKKSLLENILIEENILPNYLKVANSVREKSADIISYRFDKEKYNPFRLAEVNYLLNYPLNTPRVTREMTNHIKKYFNNTDREFSPLLNFMGKKIDVNYSPEKFYKFPPDLTLNLFVKSIIKLFKKASSIRDEAFSKLSEKEIEFLFSYSKTFLPKTGEKADINELEQEEDLLRFLKLALKVDFKKLFYSSQIILHAFDTNTIEQLKQFRVKKEKLFISNIGQSNMVFGDVILNKKTAIGRIIIGGPGQTIYSQNTAIIIDLGGDDIYYNNAGSSTQKIPLSVLIDISGNDKYISSQLCTQGCGMLGTGLLLDLAGDDIYHSTDISQGIGVLGNGFLIDLAGDDQYTGKSSVQGLGLFGAGLILEGGGNDRYIAERYAQGIGFTKGIGAIIEAEGSDYMLAGGKYPDFRDPDNATESYAQGFGYGLRPFYTSVGTSGGIGLVFDQQGNDTYKNDYFGQGASYWYAFGALVDDAGNDLYISGRYSQGAGIHSSVGIMIDEKGNDHYISTFGVAQGCGHDFGVGILVDNGGDDFYKGGVLVQGLGNETGIGILYDDNGNDKYISDGGGPGTGNFSPFHETGSFGLYIDAEGTDNYSNGEKNHQTLIRNNWGLFLDI